MNDFTREELYLMYQDIRYYHDMVKTDSSDYEGRCDLLKKIKKALDKKRETNEPQQSN